MNKNLLKPKIYSSKLLIMNNTIKVTFDNSKNIFSLNETKDSKRIFDLKFKNFLDYQRQAFQNLI